jgi:hypothetical protein
MTPAALKGIREDIGDCTRCKLHEQGRKQIVFGVGNPDADLMFVGEGPGADEDEQGACWDGVIWFVEVAGAVATGIMCSWSTSGRWDGSSIRKKSCCDMRERKAGRLNWLTR